MIIKKGKKMAELIEKFKNTRFPNWMRQVKAENQIHKVEAANDNITPLCQSHLLYGHLPDYIKTKNLLREYEKAFIPKFRLNLKLPVSLKRRLFRNKKNRQKVRKWIDEVEKIVNEAVLGNGADEC